MKTEEIDKDELCTETEELAEFSNESKNLNDGSSVGIIGARLIISNITISRWECTYNHTVVSRS